MKLLVSTTLAAVAVLLAPVNSFVTQANGVVRVSSPALFSTMADSGVPPASAQATSVEDAIIPTKLPSDIGMDYVPLATMLASGQLAEADQVSKTKYLFDADMILFP